MLYTFTMNSPDPVTGAVLAGGRSKRMGADKRLLVLEGRTLLERAVDLLAPLCDEVLVVAPTPPPIRVGARYVADRFPGLGLLSGIHAALEESRGSTVLCIPVDTPYLDLPWLRLLLGLGRSAGTPVVPLVGGRVHPIPGCYPKSAAAVIGQTLSRGESSASQILPRLGTVYVGEEAAEGAGCDPSALLNINSPEEWRAVAAAAKPVR
ncbi:MAG: molybdenum cofactor guanylyltransferase [Acidobacteriota bacterium]